MPKWGQGLVELSAPQETHEKNALGELDVGILIVVAALAG